MNSKSEAKTCFVLMPFSDKFDKVYQQGYQHVCDRNQLVCWREKENCDPGQITEDIVKRILSADIVIADLTGRNPNVFYELGIAHAATRKKTIMLSQSTESIPFDVSHYRVISYENSSKGIMKMRSKLDKAIKYLLSGRSEAENPIRKTVLSSPVARIEPGVGLTSLRPSFQGYSYKEMLEETGELLIVLNDGRSWVDTNRELLRARAAQDKRTKIVVLHPRSTFLSILTKKNGKKRQTQIDELWRSFRILEELRGLYGNIEIRGHHLFNPYCLFLTDKEATIMPYYYHEAGELPVFGFANMGAEGLYSSYRKDASQLWKEAELLLESDFDGQ